MPKLYMLVGVPGSGKSTWIKDQVWALGLSVVSTDPWVEDYARSQGKTYSEVFEEYMPIAVRLMTNHALTAQANNNDIIWDQTSTTRASRAKKFRMLPEYSAAKYGNSCLIKRLLTVLRLAISLVHDCNYSVSCSQEIHYRW